MSHVAIIQQIKTNVASLAKMNLLSPAIASAYLTQTEEYIPT